jgi:hypothetical protein
MRVLITLFLLHQFLTGPGASAQGVSETLLSVQFAAPLTELQSKLIYEQCRGLDPGCSVVLVPGPGELELRSVVGIPASAFMEALASVQEVQIQRWDDHTGRPHLTGMANDPPAPGVVTSPGAVNIGNGRQQTEHE